MIQMELTVHNLLWSSFICALLFFIVFVDAQYLQKRYDNCDKSNKNIEILN